MMSTHRTLSFFALVALALPGALRAEGTDTMTEKQRLEPGVDIMVDIIDFNYDTSFTWEGYTVDLGDPGHPLIPNDADIYDPDDNYIATIQSGQAIVPNMNGAWKVKPVHINTDGQNGRDPIKQWDITVLNAAPGRGRVWSKTWKFNSGNWNRASEWDGSFWAVVNGGLPGYEAVVEFRADGLAGNKWWMQANRVGILGAHGRSISEAEANGVPSIYEIYLNPPEDANYLFEIPVISNVGWEYDQNCPGVGVGVASGTLTFESNVDGTYHVVCDIDMDGLFDISSDSDVHILGPAQVGVNEVTWDGSYNTGLPAPGGDYACELWLTVGEFHYVARDVETSYEGFRLFHIDQTGEDFSRPMYWNDAEVQANAVLMPNGEFGLESSGPFGITGPDADPADPNINARSWGDFCNQGCDDGKGNDAYLDTYTWIADDRVPVPELITVFDLNIDSDGDGISDAEEICSDCQLPNAFDTDGDGLNDGEENAVGTDWCDPDSDGDSLDDGYEVGPDLNNPPDFDGDALIDALDDDDDDDGLLTILEDPNGNADVLDDDSDSDGNLNYLDPDDDGDSVPTRDEDVNNDGIYDDDTDGNYVPDYLDVDDDGDTKLTIDEVDAAIPLDGYGPDDTDGDGLPNYRDDDDDNDTIPSIFEVPMGDFDGDGWLNCVDPDDDGDLVRTDIELDNNKDNIGDYLNPDDTDGDGNFDYLDPDDDNDSVLTRDEDVDGNNHPRNDDTDEDGTWNYLDVDDDGDTLFTIEEDPDGDGNVQNDDTDGNGVPNYLDKDDDGDTLFTRNEDPDGDGDVRLDDSDAGCTPMPVGNPPPVNVVCGADGIPDYLDDDDDGDGLGTRLEDRSTPPDGLVRNDDTDGDGIADFLDVDDDDDSVPTLHEDLDHDGEYDDHDTDGDGRWDWIDPDDDGDGILTIDEDPVVPGAPHDPANDSDGDGVPDYLDPDDDNDCIPSIDEGPGDADKDGIPNYLDTDSDGDGKPDSIEAPGACDGILLDSDNNGVPNYLDRDDDGDGVPTFQELQGFNWDQAPDTDGDGNADCLDIDDDDDGIDTEIEGGFEDDFDGDGTPNHLDLDSDGDGILDEVEQAIDTDGDGAWNFLDLDSDADSYEDAHEGEVDSDDDGLPDYVDPDDDNDLVPSLEEVNGDSDGDGLEDRIDPDDDGDSIPTEQEFIDGRTFGHDVDGDGIMNWLDLNSDGDELGGDQQELRTDSDEDNIPDYLDPGGLLDIWYRGGGLCSTGVTPGGGLGGLWLATLALIFRRRSRRV